MKTLDKVFISASILLCVIGCETTDPQTPTEAAIDTTLDTEGNYVFTHFIWEREPDRAFDLNDDGVSSCQLLEELCSLRNGSESDYLKSRAHFDESVDGSGKAYNAYFELHLPIQYVVGIESAGSYLVRDNKALKINPLIFKGTVNQNGSLEYDDLTMEEDTSTSKLLCIAAGQDCSISVHDGIAETRIIYRVYIPQTGEFEDGPVYIRLQRE